MTAQLEAPVIRKPHARTSHTRPTPATPREPRTETSGVDNVVTALAVACVEIMQGRRSASTLVRWATPELIDRLRTFAQVRTKLARTRPAPATRISPGAVRVCHLRANVVEASVNIMSPDRRRAVALRLESTSGRWILHELVIV